jgi:hypothetical protein
VRRFWKRDSRLAELENELRARRSEPPTTFVRALAQRAGGETRWLRPRARLGLAAGFAVIALVAVASAGGFSAAQSTTHSAVKLIKKLGVSSTTSPTVVSSPAKDQYKGKCGQPPATPKCKITINDVSKPEGTGAPTTFTFTLKLDKPPLLPVTVDWNTRDGTAHAPGDYITGGGTVTFNPGQQTQTITVTVVGDNTKEPDETFFVDLSNPSPNAQIARTPGKGTIKNDDVAV